jgi:hypothetical protein
MALNPPGAAMQQIADWLQKLGMSEYNFAIELICS